MPKEKGSGTSRKLIFKGEQDKKSNLSIHSQPSFSDALRLLTSQLSKPYHHIPLDKPTSLIFQYTENCVRRTVHLKFDIKNDAILIKEGEPSSVYRALSNFSIKDKDRILYLSYHPSDPEIKKIREQIINLLEVKKIEDW